MNKISLDWDKIRANGSIKKKKDKYTPFISRNSLYVQTEQRETRAEKLARQIDEKKANKESSPEISILQDSKGKFYYQPRINGRFGKRVEISASLAKKLV